VNIYRCKKEQALTPDVYTSANSTKYEHSWGEFPLRERKRKLSVKHEFEKP
jgi:hypothetical protein